jgi:hypothetical protein
MSVDMYNARAENNGSGRTTTAGATAGAALSRAFGSGINGHHTCMIVLILG